jgi:hypothetical protein
LTVDAGSSAAGERADASGAGGGDAKGAAGSDEMDAAGSDAMDGTGGTSGGAGGVGGDAGPSLTEAGAVDHLVSFTFSWSYAVCAPGANCAGDIEIYDSGTIYRKAYGTIEAQGTIALADLVTARGIFEAPELVALLDAPQPDCTAVDGAESMKLVDGAGTHEKTTTACMDAPIQGAHSEVLYLAATYLQ